MSTQSLEGAVESFLAAELSLEQAESEAERKQQRRHLQIQREQLRRELRRSREERAAPSGVFRKILVAIDSSAQAAWAQEFAGRLARSFGSDLGLLHVLDTENIDVGHTWMQQSLLATLRDKGEAILREATKRIPAGINCETLLRDGQPGKAIASAAQQWNADLIVMGTHGRGRLGGLILGSTAQSVARAAPCPVMTVAHEPPPTREARPEVSRADVMCADTET